MQNGDNTLTKMNGFQMPHHQYELTYKGLDMFPYKHSCYLNGKRLALTQTEFSILQALMENCGHIVSSKEISDRVWNDIVYISRNDAIAIHVRHLREKLHDTVKPFHYVKTVWGVGYVLE